MSRIELGSGAGTSTESDAGEGGLRCPAGGHGVADLAEVVGQDAPADPPLHARPAMVTAATQAEGPLEHTDPTLDACPEAGCPAEGRPSLPRPPLRTALARFGDGHAVHAGL